MSKTIVLSLGGSLIVPNGGINTKFLRQLKRLLLSYTRRGYRFIIVTGGGTVARTYQDALRHLGIATPADLDWIGIRVSRLNAHLVRILFEKRAHPLVITDPKYVTPRLFRRGSILLAGGEKPGQSTDHVAVQLALRVGAQRIMNLSNIRYIYDDDPRRNKNAKPQRSLSWPMLQKIVGKAWNPGANIPFDPKATALAARHRLTVLFLRGDHIKNVDHALRGDRFIGTTISPNGDV